MANSAQPQVTLELALRILGLPVRKWEQLENDKWATRPRTAEENFELRQRAEKVLREKYPHALQKPG